MSFSDQTCVQQSYELTNRMEGSLCTWLTLVTSNLRPVHRKRGSSWRKCPGCPVASLSLQDFAVFKIIKKTKQPKPQFLIFHTTVLLLDVFFLSCVVLRKPVGR